MAKNGATSPDNHEDITVPIDDCGEDTNKVEEEGKSKTETSKVSFVELFRYATCGDIFLMSLGALCAFVGGAFMPAFSEIFGQIINEMFKNPDEIGSTISTLSLYMVYAGCGAAFTGFFQVATYMFTSHRQVERIRMAYMGSILRQDIGWHDAHKPGSLTSRMDSDARLIQNGINDKFSNGIYNFGTFMFGFGFGFYRSWQLTLVMLAALPVIVIVTILMTTVEAKMTKATTEGNAKSNEIAMEVIDNIKVVQVYGREDHETSRFVKAIEPCLNAGIKSTFATTLSVGSTYCVVFCVYGVSFWFSSYLIEWGENTVGEITATFFSNLIGSFGLGLMFPSGEAFIQAQGAAYGLYTTIDRIPDIDINSEGKVLKNEMSESIEMKNVEFAYPTRKEYKLFRDLNVTIKKGSTVAFSGVSGSGKSSVIQMIQRFYDPDSGAILVDGIDMKELDLFWWREQIRIVSQEPNLFSGSIIDNVRVGKEDATEEEVVDACKRANIHSLIQSLPNKYDTSVGSIGSQLSGGQKQRIAIARAIVRKPSILILDEATSALDRKSEMEVQEALDNIMHGGGLTVIVISHRLATIRNADMIHYVVHDEEKGSWISESGTFDELMEKNGLFAIASKNQGVRQAKKEKHDTEEEDENAQEVLGNPLESAGDIMTGDGEKDTEIKKDESIPDVLDNVPYYRMLKMNTENCWAIMLALVGSLMAGSLYPAMSVVMPNMLELFGTKAHDPVALREESTFWSLMYVAIGIGAFVGWGLQGFYGVAGERLTSKIRKQLFIAILRQDSAFFDTPGRDSGALSGILSGDCKAIHELWGPSIGNKIQMASSMVGGLVIAFIYQWKVALVVMGSIPIVAASQALQQVLMIGGDSGNGFNSDSIKGEVLSNIRTVTAFNLHKRKMQEFKDHIREQSYRHSYNAVIVGIMFGVSQFVMFAVFALALWYGGTLITGEEAVFKDVMVASLGVFMGSVGAGEAGGFASKLKDSGLSGRKVFGLMDRVPEIDSNAQGESCEFDGGVNITMDHVDYTYPQRPDAKVLKGLSVHFKRSSTNGLMGQTGCGKSTIIQLLARLYTYRGSITINGKDLTTLDVGEWRKNISIVSQDPSLFSGTIKENIGYSREGATDEEIEEVARLAAIHDDIMTMPGGYDTNVGYKGSALSGGQKQRVAIARALLRNPKVLLLDEATSALDNATEMKVQQGILQAQEKHHMTIVAVAHRLTTIRDSDQIVVMDSGMIIEAGSHDELIMMGGEYKERSELYQSAIQ